MSSMVYEILSAEITHIPKSLEGILGSNFNNTLCNGITWLFILWIILHSCYDKLINVLLKHFGFPQYLQTRLSSSFWLLGCFVSICAFCINSLSEHNPWCFLTSKSFFAPQNGNVLPQQSITFAILCSFFLYTGCSQGVRLSSVHCLAKFVALTAASSSAYILGFLDIPLGLGALLALTGIFEEVTKTSSSLLDAQNKICNIFISFMFASSVMLFCLVYFILVPVVFLIPLGIKLFSANLDLLLLTLFISMLCWLSLTINKSAVQNIIFHQLYHLKKKDKEGVATAGSDNAKENFKAMPFTCVGNLVECTLFPPRCDDGCVLGFLRSEAKKRKKEMLAKRKPKNKNMIIQTLKCMMTIKQKLSEKRLKRTSSEESVDESEEDRLIESESEDSDEAKEESFSIVKASAKLMKLHPIPASGEQENAQLRVNEEDVDVMESEVKNDNLDHEADTGAKAQISTDQVDNDNNPEECIAHSRQADNSENKKTKTENTKDSETVSNSEDMKAMLETSISRNPGMEG